jgi:serine/threonine protein kinase
MDELKTNPMPSDEQFDRERELFEQALAFPAGPEREAVLKQACGNEAALLKRLEGLLRAHDEVVGFLPKEGVGLRDTIIITPREKPGDRIGRYKLLQQIGEGGCGVVHMAEQTEPVRRRVALKVIKLGMDTKQVVARFEAERQALAMMDHPNIAKVLDAGATDTGRPYFVMELVRGVRITDYCDQNRLSTQNRLELFVQVCQAVQHAHQKGIIHRDLKPSNVLVTMIDGQPVPKVIDFGIAKATNQQPLTDKTLFTAFEQFIGTPAYMSPEQAEMSGVDIDTRSDIYSLGVLLYELLTGKTPFDANELLAKGLDEMRRTIREVEPVKPSTRLTQEVEVRGQRSEVRGQKEDGASSRRLLQEVRGDLDWVVMKCLEKDRARRYETANGLAGDIQRHLNNEPVVARPASNLYRLQKLARRNKLAFAAGGAIAVALVIGLGASTWEYLKERAARQRAVAAEQEKGQLLRQAEASQKKSQTEAAKATAISDLLQEMLGSANPEAMKSSEYSVRQLLDDFSAGLANQFHGQPEVEAAVRITIGRAYNTLRIADKASAHLERALTLRRKIFGAQAEQVADTLKDCAWSRAEQGPQAQVELYAREALEIYRRRGVSGRPVISILFPLQRTLINQNRFAEAETVTEEAFAIARGSPGVEFPELASMIHGLADVRNKQSRYPEAESLARKALEMHRRLHGAEHPETAWALLTLGIALRSQQKLADAEATLRESVRIFSKYYSSGYRPGDFAMNQLKVVLEAKGDSSGVAALTRDKLAEANKRVGRNEADAEAWLLRAAIEAELKEWKAATQDYDQAITLSKDQPATRRKVVGEACLELVERAGSAQPEIAERVAGQALAWFKQLAQEDPKDSEVRQDLARSPHLLADVLYGQGKWAEAEAPCREAVALFKRSAQDNPQRSDSAINLGHTLWRLADVLAKTGRRDLAESILREALQVFEQASRDFPAEPFLLQEQALSRRSLADLLHELGRFDEAEREDRAAIALYAELKAAAPAKAFYSQEEAYTSWMRADILAGAGRLDAAEAEYRNAIALHEKATANFPNQAMLTERLSTLKASLVELLRRRGKLAEAKALLEGQTNTPAEQKSEPH